MTRKCWILSIWWKKSLCHAQHEFWAYASLPSNAKEKKKVNEAFVILTGLLEDECETKLCQLLSVKHESAQNKRRCTAVGTQNQDNLERKLSR
jgi:hypothetical protein